MAFMREYGMAGDPGPRPAPRRKSAAAGPRAKAARKRFVRGQRATRAQHGAPKGPGKKKVFGGRPPTSLSQKAQAALAKLKGFDVRDPMSMFAAVSGSTDANKKGGGGHRRSRNPANVKALRHALGRVEGFGRLVKRVNKMLPRVAQYHVHPVLKHKRKRKSA
jgi:hypothetical protein